MDSRSRGGRSSRTSLSKTDSGASEGSNPSLSVSRPSRTVKATPGQSRQIQRGQGRSGAHITCRDVPNRMLGFGGISREPVPRDRGTSTRTGDDSIITSVSVTLEGRRGRCSSALVPAGGGLFALGAMLRGRQMDATTRPHCVKARRRRTHRGRCQGTLRSHPCAPLRCTLRVVRVPHGSSPMSRLKVPAR
jgi:hypothetical protein